MLRRFGPRCWMVLILMLSTTAFAGDDQILGLPRASRILRNLAYGDAAAQRLDVYIPANAHRAPIIFMVHGGGWRAGDKTARGFLQNKLAHWLPQGFILISANYRLLPAAAPLDQARDIARAASFVQQQAKSWGGDASRLILLGHSAGAHLVALVASDRALQDAAAMKPVLGTIALDSAALDVVAIMEAPHARLYDRAFGRERAYWAEVSPLQRLNMKPAPMLLACSTKREDPCPHARRFAAKLAEYQAQATVLPLALSHREINEKLGLDGEYSEAVDRFLHSLGLQF